jgi:hypothetical protein
MPDKISPSSAGDYSQNDQQNNGRKRTQLKVCELLWQALRADNVSVKPAKVFPQMPQRNLFLDGKRKPYDRRYQHYKTLGESSTFVSDLHWLVPAFATERSNLLSPA